MLLLGPSISALSVKLCSISLEVLDPDIGPRKRSTLNQSPNFQCILSHPLTFHLHFSCFLLTMTDDSIDGIYDTLKQCAMISKSAGGEHVYVA